jgi:hypothetical protein
MDWHIQDGIMVSIYVLQLSALLYLLEVGVACLYQADWVARNMEPPADQATIFYVCCGNSMKQVRYLHILSPRAWHWTARNMNLLLCVFGAYFSPKLGLKQCFSTMPALLR